MKNIKLAAIFSILPHVCALVAAIGILFVNMVFDSSHKETEIYLRAASWMVGGLVFGMVYILICLLFVAAAIRSKELSSQAGILFALTFFPLGVVTLPLFWFIGIYRPSKAVSLIDG